MQCPSEDTQQSEILLDYCANKLAPESTAKLERHIATCDSCASYVMEQRHVWIALEEWEAPPIRQDFNDRLYARIAQQDEKQSVWRRWFAWRSAVPLAAALAAVMMFVLFNTEVANQPEVQETFRADVDAEQVELVLEDLEMLKQLSPSSSQDL